MKTFILLIFFISGFFFADAYSQYYENDIIENVPLFIAKREVNKSIRDKDAEILAANKVKEVYIKNADGKPIGKMLINNFGYVEDYYSFTEETGMIETHWRYGHDINNNLTSAALRQGRLRINYFLTYENDLLASIRCDSAGVESQYDFAYENGKLIKITLLDLQRDTVAAKYFFNYDSEGKLSEVTGENNTEILYRISGETNRVSIGAPHSYTYSYAFENNRITKKAYILRDVNPNSALVTNLSTSDIFSYFPNGLIEKIETNSRSKNIYKQLFEYEYFN